MPFEPKTKFGSVMQKAFEPDNFHNIVLPLLGMAEAIASQGRSPGTGAANMMASYEKGVQSRLAQEDRKRKQETEDEDRRVKALKNKLEEDKYNSMRDLIDNPNDENWNSKYERYIKLYEPGVAVQNAYANRQGQYTQLPVPESFYKNLPSETQEQIKAMNDLGNYKAAWELSIYGSKRGAAYQYNKQLGKDRTDNQVDKAARIESFQDSELSKSLVDFDVIDGVDITDKDVVALKNAKPTIDTIDTLISEVMDKFKKTGYKFTGDDAAWYQSKIRNLQLIAKGDELYNLGVLNGPDLDLLEQTIPDFSNFKTGMKSSVFGDAVVRLETVRDLMSVKTQSFYRNHGVRLRPKQVSGGTTPAGNVTSTVTPTSPTVTPTAPSVTPQAGGEYEIGKIYMDANGNKAKYLGSGKWEEVK